MTTDNKTLADVQPGGMVRLGEHRGELDPTRIAETVGAREYGVPPYRYFAFTTAQLAAFAAALSAQPSPGGQDARSLLADEYDAAGSDKRATLIREGRDHAPSTSYALRAIEAALAARQPVRSSTVSDDMMDVVDRLGSEHDEVDPRAWDHMLIYAPTEKLAARLAAREPVGTAFPWENFPAYLIDKCEGDTISEEGLQHALAAMAKDKRYCAARQPVGEPVCFISPIDASQLRSKDKTLRWTGTYWDRPGDDAVPVYLGHPAQAVDLGQFREVMSAVNARLQDVISDSMMPWSERDKASKEQAALYPLLALIDAKGAR